MNPPARRLRAAAIAGLQLVPQTGDALARAPVTARGVPRWRAMPANGDIACTPLAQEDARLAFGPGKDFMGGDDCGGQAMIGGGDD